MSRTAENKAESPKTFISYSWSSSEHESWVLKLATELEESGVHVILDKWDLKEGADKYAFMEKMVTDPSIRKVIVVCDRIYAEKADGRKGGVGTETQIISQEIYDQVDPTDQEQKFVAVITEKDDEGKPYIPTFLKSRIYIDMSDQALYADGFEKLLRWIFDKPLLKRPERGKPPTYLFTEDQINLGTGSRFRRAIEALKQDKPSAIGAVRDYFETFAKNLESLRIEYEAGREFDDQVIESIENFLPFRDEVIDIFLAIARYRDDDEMYEVLHNFFELLLPYGFRPAESQSWKEWNADNFKFILYELFLYAAAAFLKNRKFEGVNFLVEQGYYFPPGSPEIQGGGLVPYTLFRGHLKSLEHRNQRLNLRRLSIMSDLITNRANRTDLILNDIMQADFILFIRDELRQRDDNYPYSRWFPYSLLYASGHHKPFELFARAESKKIFERLSIALGVSEKNDLVALIEKYNSGTRKLPQWQFESFSPAILMNIDKIATRP